MTLAILAAVALATSTGGGQLAETKAQKDARMKWWREARFGMFIHWGLYAVPAGKWGDRTNHGEWIMETARIPVEEYEKFVPQFNPTKFDADEWARIAKDAGVQYVVLTSKHHDGFALFDSAASDYDIMAGPFKRDILAELAPAVRRQGMTMGWYHSIMDWHHPAYVPARAWNPRQDSTRENLDDFVPYLHKQVSEILTKYGPIGVMWFDGEWESTWSDHYGKPLYELCRKLQPSVIVNNRVSNNRAGSMESVGDDQRVGDFSTPEQHIPATGLPGVDWETCMTMNDNWGWNAYDRNWKSSETLIKNLVDICSKGGNYLLNVGPRADGTFPPEAVERLRDIGQWMKKNGEAIYGTTASPFDSLPWGRCTTKATDRQSRLYLHVFEAPKDGRLVVPGIGNEAVGTKLMGGAAVPVTRQGSDLVLALPKGTHGIVPVYELTVKGRPIVYKPPVFNAETDVFVNPLSVAIESGSKDLEIRYSTDGSEPNKVYRTPVRLTASTELKAAAFHQGKRVSGIVSKRFEKVQPWPAAGPFQGMLSGLLVEKFAGTWDKMPNFDSLKPVSSSRATGIKELMEENVGQRFTGFFVVPEDDAYRFLLTSDDGSQLRIDGKLVVDNDGLHGSETKSGVAALAKGLHRIDLRWFNRTGGAVLDLSVKASGGKPRKLQELPLSHLP